MVKELHYQDRKFLNDPGFGSTASFYTELRNYYSWDKETGDRYDPFIGSGSFKVTDCHKTITLELEFDTEEKYINSMNKLIRLRDGADRVIQEIKEAKKVFEKPKE